MCALWYEIGPLESEVACWRNFVNRKQKRTLPVHCYSEISDFSSRRAEFGRLAVLGCTENLPEPLDGVTV